MRQLLRSMNFSLFLYDTNFVIMFLAITSLAVSFEGLNDSQIAFEYQLLLVSADLLHGHYLFIFTNLNDMTKTENMTPALIRKVVAPSMLYSSPPTNNPMILARLAKLLATPWTVP